MFKPLILLTLSNLFITMIVFTGFDVLYMRQPLKLYYLWAGCCLVGAAYCMFRGGVPDA